MTHAPPPIACDLSRLSADERATLMTCARALLGEVEALHETESGYRLRLREGPQTIARATSFIALDRRCCPFLRHALVSEPAGRERAGLWLELAGPEGVKSMLHGELAALLPAGLAPPVPAP
ncbi:MAG: hypothetical protein H6713_14575 [Myxococcales bacterium]|nr:hypothetical protein [Myxococcales bacterium]